MKYLIEKYWDKINLGQTENKGVRFEKLVKQLLFAEYGDINFHETKGSWDGSKDFFYYSTQNKCWVECKNCSSRLDLKILSSTLIMAQISEIDTILYYSYSSINLNTKAKLLLNADKNGKRIFFYDDTILEQKILQYWETVGTEFFPEFKAADVKDEGSDATLDTKCLLFGNPLDLDTSVSGYELKQLSLFKMFEMDICVINRENKDSVFSWGFKNLSKIKLEFEVYPEHLFKSKIDNILKPYEGKIIRLWLIPIKGDCKIPPPYINGKRLSLPANVQFKSLESIKETRLIGQSYEQCVVDFKQKVLYETSKLKMCIFYGRSGTGKSKLFQECLNISKISGYEIIDFEVVETSAHILTVTDFVQKLIIAIYNISLDSLEEIIKILKFQKDSILDITKQVEFDMLETLFNVDTDKDMQLWISQYLEPMVLKLAKAKYLIAIDNVQFFDAEIIDLVDFICTKLSIYGVQCETKFLFTFNTDYIKQNSKSALLLSKYRSNSSFTYVEHITGFRNAEECYEFLQEIFSIENVLSKKDIERLSKKINKNPFYLEQMISWLIEKDILEQNDNSWWIKNELLFKRSIRNIPSTVYDILSERWRYYKNNCEFDIEKIINLFSAIHLYSKLTKEDIDILTIPWHMVEELEKIGFLTIKNTCNVFYIMFDHDLIDDFFSKIDVRLSRHIIKFENEIKKNLRNSVVRNYFGQLYAEGKDTSFSNTLFSEICILEIDNRLSYEFYLLVFERFLNNLDYNYLHDPSMTIKNSYRIIVLIHDILGNSVMVDCVQDLLPKLKCLKNVVSYDEYGRLLLYISEAYDSMGKYTEAISLVKNYKQDAFGDNDEKLLSIEQQKLISEIYNRLHVYYRHQVTDPLDSSEIMDYLNKSKVIADRIHDSVMQYVNYSDQGYLYYDLPISDENYKNTIYYWKKACDIYEIGDANAKYINYLRKKTQIALLEHHSEKAIRAAQRGLDEIDVSQYAYQQTFFKWWFYHALAEAFLLSFDSENIDIIERTLEQALFYAEFLESNKKFYYLQLKSVFMYYVGQREIAIQLNQEAKDLLENSTYKSKLASVRQQLIENRDNFDFTAGNAGKKRLSSQIQTVDGLFNLPCM